MQEALMKRGRPAAPGLERRGAERFPICATVRVLLPDSMTACRAQMLDISDSGTALELDEPLPYGARIFIDVRHFRLWGEGHVRRCAVKGGRYLAGVVLEAPLVHNPAPEGHNFRPKMP
jgi:PilZ domain